MCMTSAAPSREGFAIGATTLQVADKTTVAEGVVHLRLIDPDGRRLPDWAPGAHLDLTLPTPHGTITRQYSLCGDRWDAYAYEVAVLREPDGRGGSAYVHDQLKVGDNVGIGGPRNNFPLAPAAEYLFIAGGIGITPILAMIDAAERLDAPWCLLYGGRTRSSMAFLDRLAQHGDRVAVRPLDEFGLLDLETAINELPSGTKVYCCGPAPLLNAVADLTLDWPAGAVRSERFVPLVQGPPARQEPFLLELAHSGRSVEVQASESVLEALQRIGSPVLSSCREGTCGTCETGVLDGVPDHRDSLLDDHERAACDRMFVCVSRAVSDRLVLDL